MLEVPTTPFVKSSSPDGVYVELLLEEVEPGAPVQLLGAVNAELPVPPAKVPLVKSRFDVVLSGSLFSSFGSQAIANIEKTRHTAKINAVKIKILFLFI